MTPYPIVDCLLAGAHLTCIAVGGMLLFRKRTSPALAAVAAAVAIAALGATVGWYACLAFCEFVPVVAHSGGGYVSFAFCWQDVLYPHLTYGSSNEVKSVAESLNLRLGLAGAAAGAVVALGLTVLFRKDPVPIG